MVNANGENNHLGLTDEEANRSREQHGSNLLTPPKRTSLWKPYLRSEERRVGKEC